MPLSDYEFVLEQATDMNLYQVALGGGNPNQHPQFEKILRLTRQKYGVPPSYTTNGRGLDRSTLIATKDYCGAVAVSAYQPFQELEKAISILRSYSIKTNLHFVLSSNSLSTAINWLKEVPDFLHDLNAIIFLAYKPTGRGASDSLTVKSDSILESFFETISVNQYPFKIGFDSCCVSGIVSHTEYDSTVVEACEAARFSAFISEDMRMYPCSFMINLVDGESLRTTSMRDIWIKGKDFIEIRKKLGMNECNGCHHYETCLGGCPVFDQIAMCREAYHKNRPGNKTQAVHFESGLTDY